MPRGAKLDRFVTILLRKNRFLFDNRSFVGHDSNMTPHLYLYGEDKSKQRARVFSDSKARCAECRQSIYWETFEWDHKQGGLTGRCDCLHNAAALCHDCHAKKHVAPRWTPRGNAR